MVTAQSNVGANQGAIQAVEEIQENNRHQEAQRPQPLDNDV